MNFLNKMELKDYFGNELKDGFYLFVDMIQSNILYVQVPEDRNSFSAESAEHFCELKEDTNILEIPTKNFIPLGDNQVLEKYCSFIKSKLEELSQKS